MSCGLPCIGANVAGIKEDIEHRNTGYLSGTDHLGIAESIITLLGDESLMRAIGKNAREYILSHYSVREVLKSEIEVIKEVLS